MDKIAVLIPCYNESKTIKKLLKISKKNYQKQKFMYMIIIQKMEQTKLPKKQVQLLDTKENKEKVM